MMLKIYTSEEAQNTILKRVPLDDMPVSSRILESIKQLFGAPLTPDEAVRQILREIRSEGDDALRRWSMLLDGLDKADFRVPLSEIRAAEGRISDETTQALKESIERIRRFYSQQPLSSWSFQEGAGSLGQLVRPIRRVGIYVPGGTAPLPSSVLMSAVPAQAAGVKEIVLVVPPEKGTGKIAPVMLRLG